MSGMVDINELYITPDNKKMILDISIKNKSYYKDVYLDTVMIDTQDTFVETGVSDEWVYKRKITGEDYIAKIAWETGKVDEYMDMICTLRHLYCHCHSHCHDHHCNCHHDCHHEHDKCGHCCHDTCHCRTGETGYYSNPFTVKSINLETKKAIDGENVEFDIHEGCFYKFLEDAIITYKGETTEITMGDIYMYNGKDLTLYTDMIPLNVKHARIEILQEDICQPFTDTMFFVYIKCRGEALDSTPIVTSDCPCGQDDVWTMGVCINMFSIYRRFMCLMRELLNDCEIPKYFIDLYLRWQAVTMCIENGHYLEAILYWKRFFLFHHQRPLWENPQYIKDWTHLHQDGLLPNSNYDHPSYGFGGSLFMGGCRRCK